MKKKIDKRAPFKGLTFKEFMKKRHPDLQVIKFDGYNVLLGEFCGYAGGLMTDTGCINVCERYSSCDEACYTQDLIKIMDGEGGTWCDVCGGTIPESSDINYVSVRGKRYKCCGEDCAKKVRAK